MGKVTAGLLLVLCVIFTLFIFAADRLYFRVRALERRLESLESRLSNGIYLPEAQADKLRDGSFANVEYMDPERAYGSVLRIAISADIPNLNPVTSMEAEASRLHSFCTHSLAERNYGNIDVFEPVLAESWEFSPDGLRFRIKLRQGVYWHDFTDPESGKEYRNVEMTADDFAFYFQAVNDPAVNCAHLRSYYQGVEECRVTKL